MSLTSPGTLKLVGLFAPAAIGSRLCVVYFVLILLLSPIFITLSVFNTFLTLSPFKICCFYNLL